jgi:hypothetical protein
MCTHKDQSRRPRSCHLILIRPSTSSDALNSPRHAADAAFSLAFYEKPDSFPQGWIVKARAFGVC